MLKSTLSSFRMDADERMQARAGARWVRGRLECPEDYSNLRSSLGLYFNLPSTLSEMAYPVTQGNSCPLTSLLTVLDTTLNRLYKIERPL